MAELVDHRRADALGHGEDARLGGRIQQELQEQLRAEADAALEDRDEVRMGGYKPIPLGPGGGHGGGQAGALAGGEVHQGARGAQGAPGDSAVAGGVTGPVAPEPAGSSSVIQGVFFYWSPLN